VSLSEQEVWLLIGALVLMTAAIKAIGPALVGGRELPAWSAGVIALLAPALLTALVVTAVFADGRRLAVGADTAGVAVATVLLIRRAPLVLVCAVAVLVTAGLRWLT
jgi:branched-subunit amino acid transport protein